MFTFTSTGIKDVDIKLLSLISITPGERLYPLDDVVIYFVSSIFSISLFINSIVKSISSRLFYSTFLKSYLNSFLRVSRSDNLYSLCPIFIRFPLFLISSRCNSLTFWVLSLNNSRSSIIVSDHPLEYQCPGVITETLLFSSVIIKTELVASKEVTANNHLLSSAKYIGWLNEKASICLFSLNSSVSCGLDFVCWINVSVCF